MIVQRLKDMNVGERTNEYTRHPEIVTRLLQKYVADGRSTPGPTQKNDAPVVIWKKNAPR